MKFIIGTLLYFSLAQFSMGQSFQSDIQQLTIFKSELARMFQEMQSQSDATNRHEKGYISKSEHDQIEHLLFRYLMARESIWQIISRYRGYANMYEDETANMKAFIIGLNAALTLYKYSGILVTTYMDDEQIVDKLNESYYRVDIPEGSYDRILHSLTLPKNLKDLNIAWVLYQQEMAEPNSILNALKTQTEFAPLFQNLDLLFSDYHITRDRILAYHSLITPELTNGLRHSQIQKDVDGLIEELGNRFKVIRAIVYTEIGDIKSRGSRPIFFSEKQLGQIKSILKPGDIILTYSEGYLSNIFLPGVFKHGILYTGSFSQWTASQIQSMDLSPEKRAMIKPNHDIVESVSEGVISNSIEQVLIDHGVNRLMVIRPKLDEKDIIKGIASAYAFLGSPYDFSFDFNDASLQVCTELIYRAYDGMADISFELTERAGVMTLSAEDVARTAKVDKALKIILLAQEDPKIKDQAKIYKGLRSRWVTSRLLD